MAIGPKRVVLILTLGSSLLSGGCAITPEPMSQVETQLYAGDKLERFAANQDPITGPIDLYEATARALKYNLDAKVEVMQRAVRMKDLDLSTYNLLPQLTANSGYAGRDEQSASRSMSILTGRESLEASTSQDKEVMNADLSFSWNILDFGLSYVRAHQLSDEALIAEETRRKVVMRIFEDVRTAYWRAASGEHMLRRLKDLEARTAKALRESRQLAKAAETSPLTALTYQRELIGIRREIHALEGDLSVAKAQLAALMNVPPGEHFSLVHQPHGASEIGLATEELIEIAMTHRPEITELALRQRINEQEATAALLALLPGIQAYTGVNADSNSFLVNADWISWGAKASWNLLKVFQYPAQRRLIDAKGALIDEQSLALTMAVMTQVHVSKMRYHLAESELRTAREYHDVQNKILDQIKAQHSAGRVSDQALIREEMNTLVAEVKRDIAYASLQNAVGSIYSSIGIAPFAADQVLEGDVHSIAANLRANQGASVANAHSDTAPDFVTWTTTVH